MDGFIFSMNFKNKCSATSVVVSFNKTQWVLQSITSNFANWSNVLSTFTVIIDEKYEKSQCSSCL